MKRLLVVLLSFSLYGLTMPPRVDSEILQKPIPVIFYEEYRFNGLDIPDIMFGENLEDARDCKTPDLTQPDKSDDDDKK